MAKTKQNPESILEVMLQKTIGEWVDKFRDLSEEEYCRAADNALCGLAAGFQMRLEELQFESEEE